MHIHSSCSGSAVWIRDAWFNLECRRRTQYRTMITTHCSAHHALRATAMAPSSATRRRRQPAARLQPLRSTCAPPWRIRERTVEQADRKEEKEVVVGAWFRAPLLLDRHPRSALAAVHEHFDADASLGSGTVHTAVSMAASATLVLPAVPAGPECRASTTGSSIPAAAARARKCALCSPASAREHP